MDQNQSTPKSIAKWGFGMAPLSKTMRERYDNAVRGLTLFLQGEICVDEIRLETLSEVKGMFNRSIKKDQWDWFTVYERLGYPPKGEMQYFVSRLVELRRSIRDLEPEKVKTIKNELVHSTLPYYLDCWRDTKVQEEDNQHGWLYILSTKSQPNILKIGMTLRTVPERISEINSATGVLYPLSARTVYKVKDAKAAERRVFQLLSDYRVRRDREFFEIPFIEAVRIIEEELFHDLILKRNQGIVTWFSEKKGYGFVRQEDGNEIFVHSSSIIGHSTQSLKPGQMVEFDIKNSSKGMEAIKVVVVVE